MTLFFRSQGSRETESPAGQIGGHPSAPPEGNRQFAPVILFGTPSLKQVPGRTGKLPMTGTASPAERCAGATFAIGRVAGVRLAPSRQIHNHDTRAAVA